MKTEAPTGGSVVAGPAAVRYTHVLVPLDGSDFAAVALDTAAVLAHRFGAQLDVINVIEAGRGSDEARAHAQLAESDAHLDVVLGGDPATEISRRVAELEPCLVCLSTHGHGRLAGSVIGSVARELLRRVAVPIIAIGPSARAPAFVDGWPSPLSIPHLVACVDGTAASEAVLPVAAAWARTLDMALTLLIVAEPAPAELRPAPTPEAGALSAAEAASYVERLAVIWRNQAPAVTGVVALDPISTAEGVKAYLAAHPAGLVAATTHNRNGLRRIWFGATVASIVHASVVPVLVVPIDD